MRATLAKSVREARSGPPTLKHYVELVANGAPRSPPRKALGLNWGSCFTRGDRRTSGLLIAPKPGERLDIANMGVMEPSRGERRGRNEGGEDEGSAP